MTRILNRIIIIEAFVLVCLLFGGCSTFKFSPLATVEINDSANGNTVPVSAVP